MLHGVIQSANCKIMIQFSFRISFLSPDIISSYQINIKELFRLFLRISYLHVKSTLQRTKAHHAFLKKSKIYVSINKVDCTIYCLTYLPVSCQVHITELNSQKSEINIQNTNRAYHINIQYFHFCCAFRIII